MKAYWIAVYKGLKNVNNLQGYAEKATIAIKKYNGKFLVRGGRTETLEGTPSPRTVLIEFPSIEDALNCYNSPEYQEAFNILKGHVIRQHQTVEGA